jgi:hypothetical protein
MQPIAARNALLPAGAFDLARTRRITPRFLIGAEGRRSRIRPRDLVSGASPVDVTTKLIDGRRLWFRHGWSRLPLSTRSPVRVMDVGNAARPSVFRGLLSRVFREKLARRAERRVERIGGSGPRSLAQAACQPMIARPGEISPAALIAAPARPRNSRFR